MTVPRLKIDAITKTLGSMEFKFDLTIPAPGIVAVVGPSGAGKSTLFNLIAGFEEPDGGRIFIDGVDVTTTFAGDRPLTFIFQEHNLFAHLDICANVGLGINPSLRLDASQKRAISQALSRVGLTGFETRMPASLSGGERQRVAFARALVRSRPLLLLDEPFAALDHELRDDMGDLLVSLQAETGSLVLIITHDRNEADSIAGKTVNIRSGRIESVEER